MIKEAFLAGQETALEELSMFKVAKEEKKDHRLNSALWSSMFGPFGGLAAEKGKGWQTAGGAVAGGILGNAALGHVGNIAGSGLGAYLAHGKNKWEKK